MEIFSIATALFQFLASLMSLLSRAISECPWTRYSRKSPSAQGDTGRRGHGQLVRDV